MNASQKKNTKPKNGGSVPKKGGTTAKNTKRGGSNLTKQMSDLAVPFGLILAKQSLQKFLNSDNTSSVKKSNKTSMKKVSLTGGGSCGSSKNDSKVEAFERAKTPYASVGGKSSTTKNTRR